MSAQVSRTLAALHRLPYRAEDFPSRTPTRTRRSRTCGRCRWSSTRTRPAPSCRRGDAAARRRAAAGTGAAPGGRGRVVRVPVHGDLRLDQFLLGDTTLHLNDWEEFRLGDPARDVGAYAGEWLHRAVLRIPAQETDDAFSAVLTHEEVVARGSEELTRVLPLISAFHRGYREGGGPEDDGLVVRATSYAGWHLIDRLIASTRESGLGCRPSSGRRRASAGPRCSTRGASSPRSDWGGFMSTHVEGDRAARPRAGADRHGRGARTGALARTSPGAGGRTDRAGRQDGVGAGRRGDRRVRVGDAFHARPHPVRGAAHRARGQGPHPGHNLARA